VHGLCNPSSIILWHVNPLLVAQFVSRHRLVNKVSAQTRWCHATALEYGSCATVPRSCDDVICVYMVARRRAAILSDTTVGGVLMVRRPATASKTTQWPLLGTANTAQHSGRFRGVRAEEISWGPAAIQSQFVRSSPTSEVSVGDSHGKFACEEELQTICSVMTFY
jgi:hypothetical protein